MSVEYFIGMAANILQQPNDPAPKAQAAPSTSSSSASAGNAGLGVGLYAFIVIGGAVAFGAYKYLEANKEKI